MKTPIAIVANKEQFQELLGRHRQLKGQTGVWIYRQTIRQKYRQRDRQRDG